MSEPMLIEDRTEKVYLYDCPDCGYPEAQHKYIQHSHKGHPTESTLIIIDCPDCNYHEFYTEGKDI